MIIFRRFRPIWRCGFNFTIAVKVNYCYAYRWCEDSREYTWADECWLGTRTGPRRYCSPVGFVDASYPGIGTSPCTLGLLCTSADPLSANLPFPHCLAYVPKTPVDTNYFHVSFILVNSRSNFGGESLLHVYIDWKEYWMILILHDIFHHLDKWVTIFRFSVSDTWQIFLILTSNN